MSPRVSRAEAPYRAANAHAKHARWADAVPLYREALRIEPSHLNALLNLGTSLSNLGRHDEALPVIRRAIGVAPDSVLAHRNAAAVYQAIGDLTGAIRHQRALVALLPDDVEPVIALARCLYQSSAHQEATDLLKRATRQWPDNAEVYNGLAAQARLNHNVDGALELYRHALARDPDHASALQNVSNLLNETGRVPEARRALDRLARLQARPDPATVLRRAFLCPPIAPSTAAIDRYRQRVRAVMADMTAQGLSVELNEVGSSQAEPPVEWAYQAEDNRELKAAHTHLFAATLNAPAVERAPRRAGRWKVGFVVTTGHAGIFARCMAPLVNRLDRTRFDVTVACDRAVWPALRQEFTAEDTSWLHLPRLFDMTAQALRAAELDLIYHWEVGTDSTNTFLPHLRLAPVQVTGWGWPDTSGAPELDAHLTSADLVTPDTAERYTEQLVAMPGLPPFMSRPPTGEGSSRHGLPDGATLYACAQSLRKIHPDMDGLFGGILRRDPDGVIVLAHDRHPAFAALLQRRWATSLPDVADRIVVLPKLAPPEYRRFLAAADVSLDPRPFGGATTTYDAISAGLPVVTWPGAVPRGRYSAALLRKAGVEECVVSDAETYIGRAVQIATNSELRESLRSRLLSDGLAIFEDPAAVTQLEDTFTQLLETA